MDLKDLYRDVIVDHNRHPRNFGKLDPADAHADGHNPLCGDRLTVYVNLDGERISEAKFEGSGCAISVASASLLTEAVKGKIDRGSESLVRRRACAAHPARRERRSKQARQARRAVGRARIPRPREMRQPVLAHTERCARSRRRTCRLLNKRPPPCTATTTNPSSCNATSKPSWCRRAFPVTLRQGKTGFITQALGGSFTVYVEGNLFRIPGKDADALGKEVCRRPRTAARRHRRGREATGVGPDAHLLRPGNSDQHRRTGPGVHVRHQRTRPKANASPTSR